MQELQLDHTLFFNQLEKLSSGADLKELFGATSYTLLNEEKLNKLQNFIRTYESRINSNTISKEESLVMMKTANPKFILRNYLLYECIEEIGNGKTEMLDKLTLALKNPYEEMFPEFSGKRPAGYDDTAGCSTLSCSS